MNIKRGKKRLLIGVPAMSIFVVFFGGVRLWAMYEKMTTVWSAGFVFTFIILLIWFFVRTMRWIVSGFDFFDDKMMSMREIEDKREKLLTVLQEDDFTERRSKLRAVADGREPNENQQTGRQNFWQINFGDTTFQQTHSKGLKGLPPLYKLYGFIFITLAFCSSVIMGLILLLIGPPPR
jgi:hypothetical protein